MIRDQTIVSARAEKRKEAVGQRVVRRILTASMAAVLTLPSLAAWGWMPAQTSRSRGTPSDDRAAADPVSGFDALVEVGCRGEHAEGRHPAFTDPGPIGNQAHAGRRR